MEERRGTEIGRGGHVCKGSVPHRQFFFDEEGPTGAYSVHHVYGPIEKVECRIEDEGLGFDNVTLGDPILLENGCYGSYSTIRTPDHKVMRIGLWESRDALNWSPRYLGRVEKEGRDTNLIHFEGLPGDQTAVAGPNVVRLRDGRWRMYFWKHREGHLRLIIAESDDGLGWRVPDFDKPALYHPHDGGLWKLAEGLTVHETIEAKLSPDEILARKRLWTNDSLNIYFNPQLDRFECYGVWLHPAIPDRRVDVDNAPGIHRLIHRRLSEDGIAWSDPELIIMPDDRDPWDLQFYFLGVQWYEDFMIGSLGYYRVEDGRQTMDTDLCFSRDGFRWQRPIRGGWIPRSEEGPGTMDTMGIYAGSSWIDLGDRWLCLYSATPQPHNSRVCEFATMGATFAKNRFVGLAARRVPGGFLTEPFFPSEPEVRLDANVRGRLRAELCDAFGRKLPGFHLMDSIPLRGDSEAHVLRWKSADIAVHRHECLRLRFEFADGEIYSVSY
jgi:hypothetical protein